MKEADVQARSRWRDDAPPDLVLLAVGKCLTGVMDAAAWRELGMLTGTRDVIESHRRLLRSLSWGDEDYPDAVLQVVPDVLGERRGPRSRALENRFPNLEVVSDFVNAPEWLAHNEPALYSQVCEPDDQDATLPDGTVLDAVEAAAVRLEVGEMRRQVSRIRRDFGDDPEALVGQAKELVESVCKTILGLTGDASRTAEDLPALISKTLRHLGLSPDGVSTTDKDEAKALKRLFGGLSGVLAGANELRNARGTGHGRSGTPIVDEALARMTAGMVLAATVYLCEAYEATTAPGDQRPTLVGGPSDAPPVPAGFDLDMQVGVGAIVHHSTFGRGTVVAVRGSGSVSQAQVDFGGQLKWLMLKYAPLKFADRTP